MKIGELIDGGEQTAQNVRAVLNILLESPYFYKTDDERLFLVLMRYKRAFEAFFDKFFGWSLVMDAKCARLYKPKWFNETITLPNRDMFTFTKREIRHSVSLIVIKDENLDVHLTPVIWRNMPTQTDLLGANTPEVGMTVKEETK